MQVLLFLATITKDKNNLRNVARYKILILKMSLILQLMTNRK